MNVRSFLAAACVALGTVLQPAAAAPQTYNFDAPSFAFLETTPLLDRAPNFGDPWFRSDFTSGATHEMVVIDSGNIAPSFFPGGFLISRGGSPTTLTITFNTLVDAVSFDFLVEFYGQALRVDSAAEDFDLVASIVASGLLGGLADLHFATPINSLALSVSGGGFAIDNLVLQPVPEPSTFALMAVGAGGLVARRRRPR